MMGTNACLNRWVQRSDGSCCIFHLLGGGLKIPLLKNSEIFFFILQLCVVREGKIVLFGDRRECSCSWKTLKLARMIVPIAGNTSELSELMSERFGSKESAASILYTTINSVLCWWSCSVQQHETCQDDGTYCRQRVRALSIGVRIFWLRGIGQTCAFLLCTGAHTQLRSQWGLQRRKRALNSWPEISFPQQQ